MLLHATVPCWFMAAVNMNLPRKCERELIFFVNIKWQISPKMRIPETLDVCLHFKACGMVRSTVQQDKLQKGTILCLKTSFYRTRCDWLHLLLFYINSTPDLGKGKESHGVCWALHPVNLLRQSLLCYTFCCEVSSGIVTLADEAAFRHLMGVFEKHWRGIFAVVAVVVFINCSILWELSCQEAAKECDAHPGEW